MEVIGKILRTLALAVLFGGSIATIIAAVTLVKAAQAQGVPVAEAAARNAPVFITYAKVNLGAGILLLIGEALDFAKRRLWTKMTIAQIMCSMLCVGTTMIFALGIVPPMEALAPRIATDPSAHAEFHALHEVSRAVFGGTIVLALASLILPIFGALRSKDPSTDSA